MRENVILTFDVARPRLQSVQTSLIRQTDKSGLQNFLTFAKSRDSKSLRQLCKKGRYN